MNDKIVISSLTFDQLQSICGNHDENLRSIEELLAVKVVVVSETLIITGTKEQCNLANKVFLALIECCEKNQFFTLREVVYLCQLALAGKSVNIAKLFEMPIIANHFGKHIFPKTNNQKTLLEAMTNNDIVFAIGPAGTGKTFLAVAYAIACLKRNSVSKIILTRPAVEAGENLGFLPGDLKEKVDPYLQPLYDAIINIVGKEKAEKYLTSGIIEVIPLAFMRGRTLENAFIILDEAQNTTKTQMKMFLTRLGFNSKMVINGDITQIDLPKNIKSGLIDSVDVIKKINEIKIVHLSSIDVVRNPLVQKIIEAYQEKENDKDSNN